MEGPPAVADYLLLRDRAGLTPRREDQASAALRGSWAVVHVIREADARAVGMGRIVGDGGWYFHIVDMAVLPEHQRRGLGDAILTDLVGRVSRESPPGVYVSLIADPPGRRLYDRHGFAATAPGSNRHGPEARVNEQSSGTRACHPVSGLRSR